ncbi:hypothetical protein KAURM247S_04453 [Kitasatospora aureofaciens]
MVLKVEGFAPRPPVDRSALLAFDVDDEDGLQTGITVLTEMLSRLRVGKVPGVKTDHVLGRLKDWLTHTLPTIDAHAVGRAVKTLDSVREIHNSTVHPKPGRDLLEAYQQLGLPYPITDPAMAWDSIRAHRARPHRPARGDPRRASRTAVGHGTTLLSPKGGPLLGHRAGQAEGGPAPAHHRGGAVSVAGSEAAEHRHHGEPRLLVVRHRTVGIDGSLAANVTHRDDSCSNALLLGKEGSLTGPTELAMPEA